MAASEHELVNLIEKDMNLDVYPDPISLPDDTNEIQFGDMHGNTLKMISLLKATGVIDIPEDQYMAFVALYRETYNLMELHSNKNKSADPNARFNAWLTYTQKHRVFRKEKMELLDSILKSIRVVDKDKFVTFLGDILSDRGASDLFTLKLLQHLKREGMNYRIIFSNHDLEFVWQLERMLKKAPDTGQPIMYNFAGRDDRHQGASVHHLLACVRQHFISRKEVKEMVLEAYYPHLSWFDYTIPKDGEGIAIITHAPLQLSDIVSHASNQLGIYLDTIHRSRFTEKLEQINEMMYQILKNFAFTKNVSSDYHTRRSNSTYVSLWSRATSSDAPSSSSFRRETEHETMGPISFIHGHNLDPRGSQPRKGIICLDDALGKTIELHQGEVKIAALVNSQRPEIRAVAQSQAERSSTSPAFFSQQGTPTDDRDPSHGPGTSSQL